MLCYKIVSLIVVALCLLMAAARKDRGRGERESDQESEGASPRAESSCEDRASWCKKIGSKLPLSRCYRSERRCCLTCSRLKLPLQGCPYGDQKPWCSDLGNDRPTSECYKFNATCCQTCHLFDSGLTECPYGDKQSWCTDIGTRYSVSSCYEHQNNCCDTCGRFETKIPECPYGDRLTWCTGIGNYFSEDHCQNSNKQICCNTCHLLAMKTSTTSLPTSTPATQRYGNTTFKTNSTTSVTIFVNGTSLHVTESHGMDNKSNPSSNMSSHLDNIEKEFQEPLTSSSTSPVPTSYQTTTLSLFFGRTSTLALGNKSSTATAVAITPKYTSRRNATGTSRDESRGNETTTLVPKVVTSLAQRPHRHEKGSHNKTRDSHRKHHHRSRNSTETEQAVSEVGRDRSDIPLDIVKYNTSVSSDNDTTTNPHTLTRDKVTISTDRPLEVNNNGNSSKSDSKENRRPKYLDPSQEFLENHVLSRSTINYLSEIIYLTISIYHILLLANIFGGS